MFDAGGLDVHTLINAVAALTTIVAAILVASNFSPSVMVTGFVTFVVASILWIVSGFFAGTMSLVIQNIALLIINLVGVYRWMPRAA